jgi:hypothetical protein
MPWRMVRDSDVAKTTASHCRCRLRFQSLPPTAIHTPATCHNHLGSCRDRWQKAVRELARIGIWRADAYRISRKGCLHLLQHLLPMRAHIDHQISDALIRHRGLPLRRRRYAHDFSSWSDAYIPLAAANEAD